MIKNFPLRARRLFSHWVVCGLFLLGAASCGDSGERVGGETHWLESCTTDETCGPDASCECGVCTRVCDQDDGCATAGELTSCAPPASEGARTLCGVEPPAGVCLPECALDDDCAPFGPSFRCAAGHCVSPPPSTLEWFTTCGDPVCMGHRPGALPECSGAQEQGNPCAESGSECDLMDSCNTRLICAAQDPKMGPGGCPISRRRHKEDIRYLGDADLAVAHKTLMSMPLATYRYRRANERTHLGFIMEDVEPSLAVDSQRGTVDLYGYTSLAVAALKAQDRRIKALEGEVRTLRGMLNPQENLSGSWGPACMP